MAHTCPIRRWPGQVAGRAYGTTSLVAAAQHGHEAVVSALHAAGADKDKAAKGGSTPLYMASQMGHTDIVEMLLDAGADKDKPQKGGATPLYMAAWGGHTAVVTAMHPILRAVAVCSLARRSRRSSMTYTAEAKTKVEEPRRQGV